MVPFVYALLDINSVSSWATIIGAIPVVAGIIVVLYKVCIKISRVLALTDHELQPNGGNSVADNARFAREHSEEALATAKKAAEAAERAADGVVSMHSQLTAYVTASTQTQAHVWGAIEDLRHAINNPNPPEGPQIRAVQ